jgi:hypothetical protein
MSDRDSARTLGDAPEDDEPITLAEACRLFPHAKLTVWTLRAEAQRGRLDIFRLGKRDCTTPRAMREMVKLCQDADHRRVSTSTRQDETERHASAQAALSLTMQDLKASRRRNA